MAATVIPLVTLALILAILVLAWPRGSSSRNAPPRATRSELEYAERHYRRVREQMLDRTPFGEAFARRMWRAIANANVGDGIIPNMHKEYCGHGLVRTESGGVALKEVHDSHTSGTRLIAGWDDQESFVAFFARQSNYSVNGYDPAEPVFHTESEWDRGNQRLIRQDIERVLDSSGSDG